MAAVPQRNSKPEIVVRQALHRRGHRYRLHGKSLPGRPDFYFPRARVAVFVNGCFWHRHEGCPRTTTPKNNYDFWQKKFAANIARDQRNYAALRELGWEPVIVWECEIKRDPSAAADHVEQAIQSRTRVNQA